MDMIERITRRNSVFSPVSSRKDKISYLTIREFTPEDARSVQQICYAHFRSLSFPAVLYWICQHIIDLLALLVIINFFMSLKEVVISSVVFIIYLFCRSRFEMESYIRNDCPDLKDIYSAYMKDSKMHFWVAELLEIEKSDYIRQKSSESLKCTTDKRGADVAHIKEKSICNEERNECHEKTSELKKKTNWCEVETKIFNVEKLNNFCEEIKILYEKDYIKEKQMSLLQEEGKVERIEGEEVNEKQVENLQDDRSLYKNNIDLQMEQLLLDNNKEVDNSRIIEIIKGSQNKSISLKLIGCIGLAPHKDDKNVAQLVRLVVSHESRRMRIGSRLLLQLENYAKDMGYKEMRLYTNNLSTTPLKFVRENGYILIQVVRRGLMRGDLLLWRKFLTNNKNIVKSPILRVPNKITDVLD